MLQWLWWSGWLRNATVVGPVGMVKNATVAVVVVVVKNATIVVLALAANITLKVYSIYIP